MVCEWVVVSCCCGRLARTEELDMADNTKHSGPPDPSLINLNQDHEIRYWTKELGVSEKDLRAAVREVGNAVAKVRAYLKQKR